MAAQFSLDLEAGAPDTSRELGPGVMLLPGFAVAVEDPLLAGVDAVTAEAPFRHMVTPGGFTMSVAMTNCGALGWVSDRRGYRYDAVDPETGKPWPPMPDAFRNLAERAAEGAGFPGFLPDACLINRYRPGSRLSLHQDRNEIDMTAPIVSVSLGLPATFQMGGDRRAERPQKVELGHGDVMVWGGPARLRFHGVLPLRKGEHPRLGPWRVNLTFRKAGP